MQAPFDRYAQDGLACCVNGHRTTDTSGFACNSSEIDKIQYIGRLNVARSLKNNANFSVLPALARKRAKPNIEGRSAAQQQEGRCAVIQEG